jgi:transposase InsO family protein
MGEEAWQRENRTYLKIIPALFAGDQWMMDGWRIPIYCKRRNDKGGMEYFVTYNLFAVMDAHSRRIIGYDVAESENTENILKGLERAVETTGTLPYEIVADNHAWNKTKEADNFKEETERLGVHWTIDSNPRAVKLYWSVRSVHLETITSKPVMAISVRELRRK